MCRTATIWNNENIRFLKENYECVSNSKLAMALDISVSSIKLKAKELGLKKVCAKRKLFLGVEEKVIKMSKDKSYVLY